jgi:hypothetical protein
LGTVRERLEEVDREVVTLEALIARSRELEHTESHSQDTSDEEDELRGGQVSRNLVQLLTCTLAIVCTW